MSKGMKRALVITICVMFALGIGFVVMCVGVYENTRKQGAKYDRDYHLVSGSVEPVRYYPDKEESELIASVSRDGYNNYMLTLQVKNSNIDCMGVGFYLDDMKIVDCEGNLLPVKRIPYYSGAAAAKVNDIEIIPGMLTANVYYYIGVDAKNSKQPVKVYKSPQSEEYIEVNLW